MKIRQPKTFEDAITQMMGVMTAEVCAEVVGKSASLVRKWGDPDDAAVPSLMQALLLDIAYAREGHGEGLILTVYMELFKQMAEGYRAPQAPCIKNGALQVQGGVGRLASAVVDAVAPGSDGGECITPAEARGIYDIFRNIKKHISATEEAILSKIINQKP